MKKRPLDIEGLIVQVQQQLTYLDKKIDTLISQVSAKPFDAGQRPEPSGNSQLFQPIDQPARQSDTRQTNNYNDRILHKTTCVDCRKECEVPFRPSGDRPVYCKACFAKHKTGSSFKVNKDNRSRGRERTRERPSHKHAGGENSKSYFQKTFAKKRQRRY
jgi:CxxC-x17-CxxC domain-containing protein